MIPLIQCENLWKTFGMGDVQVMALRDVTLTIRQGEVVAIMGPSGSGKSTLMSILGCLDRPTAGHYYFRGRDVAQATADDLADIRNRDIGFVFQSFNLIPRTSAWENVQLPLLYRGLSHRESLGLAQAALSQVGLGNRAAHTAAQLSGGQQQRVAIARALVGSPSVILADEPTGNLDTTASHDIMRLLIDLNDRHNMTIILVTHEADIARYAKRVVVCQDGQISSDDRTVSVQHSSRSM